MTTYTLEPMSNDGVFLTTTLTQAQLGGTLAPYVKVPYPATGMPWDVQTGASNIAKLCAKGTIKAGDTVLGFSLGTQVVSLYLSKNTPPAGVRFILLGDTLWNNQKWLDAKQDYLGLGGIPWDIKNEVILVANEFDGYSDFPDKTTAPGYSLAVSNAFAGMQFVHNYVFARLEDPANVVTKKGNITAILVPTEVLPINALSRVNQPGQREQINGAYSRLAPTAAQVAAAKAEQVPFPAPPVAMKPEPVAAV